jgi:hypothetical protein
VCVVCCERGAPSGGGSPECVLVNPLPRALLQIQEEAEHVTTAHSVGAVVTGMPEDHALTGERVESDLLGCCAVGVEDDDWIHGLLGLFL